jgi:DNA-binding CsgD family transcriptional regulator
MIPASFLISFGQSCGLKMREIEVLQLAVEGQCNKDIAARINTSEQTTKNYVRKIFRKVGCDRRSHLTAIAYEAFFQSSRYKDFLALKPQFEEWMKAQGIIERSRDRDMYFAQITGNQQVVTR